MAKSAVDAFRHVDVIARRPPAAVLTFLGLDRDSRGRADGFTKLACNATLLSGGVAPQGMFAAESGGDGTFFERVIDCVAKTLEP